jgi:hypothetical protein
MPAEDRISALVERLSGELSLQKLESLSREFDSLAQDRPETLVFFVLRSVCLRLATALEGEGVSVERHRELTAEIADQIRDILRDVQEQENINPDNLERLSLRCIEIWVYTTPDFNGQRRDQPRSQTPRPNATGRS